MANQPFRPAPEKQPDDSWIFRLRDDVVLSLRSHSEKRVVAQMWRRDVLLPSDNTIDMGSKPSRDKLIQTAKDGFNDKEERDDKGNVVKPAKVNVPNIEEDIAAVAIVIGVPLDDGESVQDKLQQQEGPSLLDRLIGFAEQHAELFHTRDKEGHASVPRNGHTETYPLDSRAFRLWLKGEFKREQKERLVAAAMARREHMAAQMGPLFDNSTPIIVPRPPVIRDQVFADALNELTAQAINDGEEHEVHLRTAKHGEKIYIDLCNDEWECIEVSSDGWQVIVDPPVKFVRSNTMRPLVRPVPGGSVEDLREILTLSDEDEDDIGAWRLILAWLVQALRPEGGQYPILVLLGGQGSAKTNTGRFLRRLVDPNVVKDTSPPKNEHDLYIRGSASWVISLDNVSSLPHWLSDGICRIATEGGFATRKLYSGREEEVFDALRPFILNGIADVASRPDILDRSLLVNLPAIKRNKSLRAVRAEFAEKEAGILGALLDALSAGLRIDLDDESAGRDLPRLADFAQWATATEEALGGEPGSFMKAYKKSRGEATHTALEAEPVVYALFRLARHYDETGPWEGTNKLLLDALNEKETDDALKRSKEWPKTPRKLSEVLKRLAPPLIEQGVHVEKVPGSRRDGRKIRVFYRKPPSEAGDDGGDGTDITVTNTVTEESPVDKPNKDYGDGGDDGDGTTPYPEDELEI